MAKGDSDIAPNSLTLRFKHGRSTIFIFAEELTPFSKIKQDLLDALHERYPDGLAPPPTSSRVRNIPIPDSSKEIVLGLLNNVNDPSDGWNEIDTTSATGVKDTPKESGLKDGSMLAFVLGGESKKPVFWAEFSNIDELYPTEED